MHLWVLFPLISVIKLRSLFKSPMSLAISKEIFERSQIFTLTED